VQSAGKAFDCDGQATRFAFVRTGGSEAANTIGLALRHCGVTEQTTEEQCIALKLHEDDPDGWNNLGAL
jgi:hypothetical protein